MQRITRLLIEARALVNPNSPLHLSWAMVEPCGAEWLAKAHLWDGEPGSGTAINTSHHADQEAAIGYLHELADRYPPTSDLSILVVDIPRGELDEETA